MSIQKTSDPLSSGDRVELETFFERSRSAEAIDSLSEFDGLACALAIGPSPISPALWLGMLHGDEPGFKSLQEAQAITSLLIRHYNHVVSQIANGSYTPLIPKKKPTRADHRAQKWAQGFVRGMSLDKAWTMLLADTRNDRMVMPIMILADSKSFIREATPDAEAMETFIDLVPHVLPIIRDYWQRPKLASLPRKTPKAKNSKVRLGTVHRLKIELLDVKPAIWRRVEIASDTKLPAVSDALLVAMGWTNTHLHCFRVGRETFGMPDPDYPTDDLDERRYTLAQVLPVVGDSLRFEYDFGDGWVHRVTTETIEAENPTHTYPRCVAGKRACPPEDCGGPWGYARFLRAIGDPKHEEHEEMLRWGGRFDAASFDVDETNRELASAFRRKRVRTTVD